MNPLGLLIYIENYWEIYLLTATFGFQLISTTYFLSFIFQKSTSANLIIPAILIIIGFVTPSVLKILVWLKFGCEAYRIAEYGFLIVPVVPYWASLYDICITKFPLVSFAEKKISE